ncbi:WSC domain-containing protein [Purpureocillium lavendulum]|uniref:WSC domain-containing protein n=1 Tax=Purpureocillium lavendulum TaxID=1247861 RepID=A0AB34FQ57_9HYPO|nr:WSC domain-containing protein [Purpureocillium lavendulum]
MKTLTVALAALLAASNACAAPDSPTKVLRDEGGTKVARQAKGKQSPSEFPLEGAFKSQGCYSSSGNMTLHKAVDKMSSGTCNKACQEDNYWVSGLKGASCYCGYALPPLGDRAKDSDCNYPCPWYDLEACGGLGKGFYSTFNLGINIEATNIQSSSSSSSSATSSSTSGDETPTPPAVTETKDSTPTPDSGSGSKPNTAGIAAGVVVGVVGLAAIIGGIFFFVRRRRNAEIEEDHRRNAAVNAFINGSKPPGSSGSISMTDARLDPVMAHRRMSDGSIADNEDYSRRILRVSRDQSQTGLENQHTDMCR